MAGAIEFKNVGLTYPGQKLPALTDVSFRVQPGERVGLIGRIGSGKTTIEKLVLGLYEPDKGAVLIDGTDLRQLDPADLRRNIGCVPQDVFLLQGSVRENITLGATFADDAAVLRAAEIAGVDDFVNRHPMGYDMPVGERGELLSGGQRQAIAVARALLLDPPIIVLDEPTSAMDNGAENRFKARLADELADRTLLLVTHRASLLGLVDRLIVMDGGRVVADGPRDAVLKALAAGQIKGVG
jgi:ATP-binding cassette subfamily C protein LapB